MAGGVTAITYEGAAAVTASDATDDPNGPFAGFIIGGSGAVACVLLTGQTVTFSAMQAGIVYTLAVRRIKVTGTTATNIIGLNVPPYRPTTNPGTGTVLP